MTPETVWMLVDGTIQADEHKSNLVFTALQYLFDAVGLTSEQVYEELCSRGIEPAPKLLVSIRKARRAHALKAKFKAKTVSVWFSTIDE